VRPASSPALFKVRQGDAASNAVARRLGATVTGMEVTEFGNISAVRRSALDSTG
jgi:hypothetical protein